MQLFLDTANLDEIREGARWGVISGITTNPSLVAKETGTDFQTIIREITEIVRGPVSAEVTSLAAEDMIREGREYASWSEHVVVKVPATPAGLTACRALSDAGIKVNYTLCFSLNQGLLGALAGATYISPFIGRLDDIGEDGMQVVRDLVEVFRVQNLPTKVLAASIRHPMHVTVAAKAGAQVATLPFKVLQQMIQHPLTDAGLEKFLSDWARTRAVGSRQ